LLNRIKYIYLLLNAVRRREEERRGEKVDVGEKKERGKKGKR